MNARNYFVNPPPKRRTTKGKMMTQSKHTAEPWEYSEMLRVAERVLTLKEPYRAQQVAKIAGIKRVQAHGWLLRAKKKGWVKTIGFGEFRRTTNFPKHTPGWAKIMGNDRTPIKNEVKP